jgi:hypothetical protein
LRHFRNQNQVYLVQDGVDVSEALDPGFLGQDTLLVDSQDPLRFYNEVDFFSTHLMTVSWQYKKT